MATSRYSEDYDPPAPVVSVRVGAPAGEAGVSLVALVDTGADVTVIPVAAAKSLSLPMVATIRIAGVTGASQANVHAALLELAGEERMVEVVALGAEAIIGRDVANRWVLTLDGPRRTLQIKARRIRAREGGRRKT